MSFLFLFLPVVSSSIPWRQGRRILLQSSSSSSCRFQGILSRSPLSFSTTAVADVATATTALSSAVGIDQSKSIIIADDRMSIQPPREEPAAANIAINITNSNSKTKGIKYSNNKITKNKNKRLTVCILGPPNAGKSTLFNRLIKKDALYRLNTSNTSTLGHRRIKTLGRAIVHSTAGTTRDRRLASAQLAGLEFDVWDTAGILNAKRGTNNNMVGGSSISGGGGNTYSNGPKTKHNGRGEPHVDVDADRLLSQSMLEHAQRAAAASDVVVLMFDARYAGLTADVLDASKWLRKMLYQDQSIHRLLFVANKLEGDAWNYDGSHILETVRDAERRLGGEIIPISAIQGEGMADLATIFHDVSRELYGDSTTTTPAPPTSRSTPKQPDQDQSDETTAAAAAATPRKHPLRLAILGRPNVGKSTLLNALVRENRVITGPTPGLTRDAIAVDWTWQGQPIQIVDTAGIRKSTSNKTAHSGGSSDHSNTNLDDLAVQDAIAAMKLAEVGVLVLDAGVGRLHQLELSICNAIMKEGRALIVAANKMDLLEFDAEYTHGDLVRQVRGQLEERFPALRQTPIIAMSSRDKIGVNKLLPVALETRERWEQTIPTSKLNRWMKEVQATTKSPIKIKYMVQTKGRPPTFILFCNRQNVRQNYENMIRRHFQESFRMFGMEVRLTFRTATNPYVNDQPRRRGFGLGGHTARKQRNLTTLRERYRGVTTKQEGRMRVDEKRRSKRKNQRQQRR